MKTFLLFLAVFLFWEGTAFAEFYNLSPNMSLPIPIPGVEPGPQYATDLNNSLTLIDGHNHTPGFGVQVPSNGININLDLPFNNNNLTVIRASRYNPQGSTPGGASDLREIYVSGVDLYYIDGNGNNVRITQSGGVAGSPGSIANLASPASATYVAATPAFVWQSAVNTAANMDMGAITLRNLTANSHGTTIQPHSSLGSDFTLTLPAALPGSLSLMTMDASGNIGTTLTPTITSLTTTGAIAAGASSTITGNLTLIGGATLFLFPSVGLVYSSVGGGGFAITTGYGFGPNGGAQGMLTGYTQAGGSTNTLAVQGATQNTQLPLVVSAQPSTNGLMIVRGGGSSTPSAGSCGTKVGEGYSCARTGAGIYAVTFTTAFADIPSCTCEGLLATCNFPVGGQPAASVVQFGLSGDVQWSFICIGQRNSSI